ncbi:MAG: phenylalanine--tRNA ligase beta subunit-related protein [Bacillus subtilis]|nr:phenylalanine--tRNA ligase beta subunit-related protein [Bacillus subtilis]
MMGVAHDVGRDARRQWRRSSRPRRMKRCRSQSAQAASSVVRECRLLLCPRSSKDVRDPRRVPAWMKARLIAAGIRPINNVVDITNYVDARDRSTAARVRLRQDRDRPDRASAPPAATPSSRPLDGKERVLVPEDLVITDGVRPIALAGVMGGRETEVGERHDEHPFGIRRVRRDPHPQDLQAPRFAQRSLDPLRARPRSRPDQARLRPRRGTLREARRRPRAFRASPSTNRSISRPCRSSLPIAKIASVTGRAYAMPPNSPTSGTASISATTTRTASSPIHDPDAPSGRQDLPGLDRRSGPHQRLPAHSDDAPRGRLQRPSHRHSESPPALVRNDPRVRSGSTRSSPIRS